MQIYFLLGIPDILWCKVVVFLVAVSKRKAIVFKIQCPQPLFITTSVTFSSLLFTNGFFCKKYNFIVSNSKKNNADKVIKEILLRSELESTTRQRQSCMRFIVYGG